MKRFAMLLREISHDSNGCGEGRAITTFEVAIGEAKTARAFIAMAREGKVNTIIEEARNGHFLSWFDGEILLPSLRNYN